MKDVRKLPHRSAPGLIPEELLAKRFACPDCGNAVAVPWLEKLPYPKQPIKSDVGKGNWVPVSFPIVCPVDSCKKEFEVRIPVIPSTNRWSLYGDEAARYITTPSPQHSDQPLHFFCITLVGLHQKKDERVRKQIYNLKRSAAPSRDPDAWQHHFTEIWSGDTESNEFILKSKVQKIAHARRLAAIIRDARPELVSFNISGCIRVPKESSERKLHVKLQKEEIFARSLLSTLQEFREQHKSISWFFDSIKDATSGQRTEGWAAECFLGLQYTRLFTWLSAGATVTAPSFVPPGSHFLSEIADFISYCVARDFEMAVRNSRPEFPSSLLGKGFFQGTLGDGDVISTSSFGLPLREFYGLSCFGI